MSKFNVGDKVRVIDASGDDHCRINDICTVQTVRGIVNDLLDVTRDSDGQMIAMYAIRFKKIELAPNKTETIEISSWSKLKAGDVVAKFDLAEYRLYVDRQVPITPSEDFKVPNGWRGVDVLPPGRQRISFRDSEGNYHYYVREDEDD